MQFRYLFVTDDDGFKVFDASSLGKPKAVPSATVPLKDGQRIYVARTFAYVAAGSEGLAIIDVEKPEKPFIYMKYTADGAISDARDVVVGSTNASAFAYVADGVNGLKVIQLTSPDSQPCYYGFSPDPKPEVIAWRKTKWPALSIARGVARDRAVDETGGQIAVLGRLGSRPFNKKEMDAFYLKPNGELWTVHDRIDMNVYVAPKRGPKKSACAN